MTSKVPARMFDFHSIKSQPAWHPDSARACPPPDVRLVIPPFVVSSSRNLSSANGREQDKNLVTVWFDRTQTNFIPVAFVTRNTGVSMQCVDVLVGLRPGMPQVYYYRCPQLFKSTIKPSPPAASFPSVTSCPVPSLASPPHPSHFLTNTTPNLPPPLPPHLPAGGGRKAAKPALDDESREEIKEAFQLFDTEGKGSIDIKELKAAFRALGFQVKKAEIKQMMGDVDKSEAETVR